MAEFHEIGSSQFTDVIPTGEEKIQISASQRTTLQNIANLATEKGVKQVVVTNFQTNTWKLRDGGSVSFPMDIKVGEIVTFTSAQDAVNGPGVGLFGYAIKYNSLMASYVGMTTSNKLNGIPTIYTYKSAGAYATAWQQLPDARISGWSDITKYGDVQDPYIQNGDTLVDALRKLQWMTGNNTVKTLGDSSGIGMIWWNGDTQNDLFTAFYLMIENHEIYFLFEGTFSDLGDQATEDQIIGYIINKGSAVYIGTTPLINYVSGTNVAMNLSGKDSLWYTGSSNPTLTLLEHTFDSLDPTASFICAYNITPTFKKQNSTSVIHMHQNAADVAPPTFGYKVYTILCQVVGSVKHFFINVAPYN